MHRITSILLSFKFEEGRNYLVIWQYVDGGITVLTWCLFFNWATKPLLTLILGFNTFLYSSSGSVHMCLATRVLS